MEEGGEEKEENVCRGFVIKEKVSGYYGDCRYLEQQKKGEMEAWRMDERGEKQKDGEGVIVVEGERECEHAWAQMEEERDV